MNHYQFPIIRNISDVLPVIKDRKEFIVADRGSYTIINYVVAMEDTFPPVKTEADAILRECRGLVFFTKTGDIMSRRFHKFFNVGEREETSPQFVDLSKPHVVLEKLDGSMITPLMVDGMLRWGTKMGVTDTALQVEEFVMKNPHYAEFANLMLSMGYTPIFEWCSRKQKIVIDYKQDQLILTAIRFTKEGNYVSHKSMGWIAGDNGIPVVKAYDSQGDIRKLMEYVKSQEDTEGVIVRFDDGHMVKVKCDWYMQLHHAKDVTKFEKNVLEIILQDKLDDLLPLLEPDYQEMVKAYRDDVFKGMRELADDLQYQFDGIIKAMRSKEKREFAIHWVKPLVQKEYQPFMYAMWDKKDPYEMLKQELLKSCSSINRLENNRWMMSGAKYNIVATESEE
jgi:RNA ligase